MFAARTSASSAGLYATRASFNSVIFYYKTAYQIQDNYNEKVLATHAFAFVPVNFIKFVVSLNKPRKTDEIKKLETKKKPF